MKLNRDFFSRPTLLVAQDLLGKELCFDNKSGIITETEAYIGMDDPACHARCGPTKRNQVMFGAAAYSYVYLIYGMYYCLNFVTEEEGFPSAVLIRGLLAKEHYDGPGKLCRYYGINLAHNNIDVVNNDSFFVSDIQRSYDFIATPRVGIKNGKEKFWRFRIIT